MSLLVNFMSVITLAVVFTGTNQSPSYDRHLRLASPPSLALVIHLSRMSVYFYPKRTPSLVALMSSGTSKVTMFMQQSCPAWSTETFCLTSNGKRIFFTKLSKQFMLLMMKLLLTWKSIKAFTIPIFKILAAPYHSAGKAKYLHQCY